MLVVTALLIASPMAPSLTAMGGDRAGDAVSFAVLEARPNIGVAVTLRSTPPVSPRSVRRIVIPASKRIQGLVTAAELRHRLPSGLLHALVLQESSYDPRAVSRRGALGLAQLMPGTARMLGVTDPFDPWMNVNGGGLYLRRLIDRFGSVGLALAAYNAGPLAVERAKGVPPFRETRRYVARVIERWIVWQKLDNRVMPAGWS